jgi:hypothetical protein
MGLVAADLLEPAAVIATEPDQDPAIAFAEDAGARFPLTRALGAHLEISLAQRSRAV